MVTVYDALSLNGAHHECMLIFCTVNYDGYTPRALTTTVIEGSYYKHCCFLLIQMLATSKITHYVCMHMYVCHVYNRAWMKVNFQFQMFVNTHTGYLTH